MRGRLSYLCDMIKTQTNVRISFGSFGIGRRWCYEFDLCQSVVIRLSEVEGRFRSSDRGNRKQSLAFFSQRVFGVCRCGISRGRNFIARKSRRRNGRRREGVANIFGRGVVFVRIPLFPPKTGAAGAVRRIFARLLGTAVLSAARVRAQKVCVAALLGGVDGSAIFPSVRQFFFLHENLRRAGCGQRTFRLSKARKAGIAVSGFLFGRLRNGRFFAAQNDEGNHDRSRADDANDGDLYARESAVSVSVGRGDFARRRR